MAGIHDKKSVEELARAALAVYSTGQPYMMFMAALATRVFDVTEAVVNAPPERTQEMQGRARELRDLMTAIEEGPKLAQELREKELRAHNGTAPRQP